MNKTMAKTHWLQSGPGDDSLGLLGCEPATCIKHRLW